MPRKEELTAMTVCKPYLLGAVDGTLGKFRNFGASVREGCYMTTFENVHKGVNGEDALTVQRLLYAQGYKGADGEPLKLDGDFGTNSEFALKEFQKARGLTVDGDCGPATWAKLFGKA